MIRIDEATDGSGRWLAHVMILSSICGKKVPILLSLTDFWRREAFSRGMNYLKRTPVRMLRRFYSYDRALSRTLFISNLPENLSVQQLLEYFQPFGVVHNYKILPPMYGHCKAIVTFKDISSAISAKDEFHSSILSGRKIFIEYSDREQRPRRTTSDSRDRYVPQNSTGIDK